MEIEISSSRDVATAAIITLYKSIEWTAANKPIELTKALRHSHTLITAWHKNKLVGLGNAISDGYLVVYYPHLLVHPDYQGQGIAQMIMHQMQEKYQHFHMQMLSADVKAVGFYEKIGFEKAGETQAMWIYSGGEH